MKLTHPTNAKGNMKIKSMLNKWNVGAVLASLYLIRLPVFAQDVEQLESGVSTPPLEETPAPSGRLPITVSGGFSHQFNTDLHDNPGSFSISRAKLSLGVPVRINEAFTLGTVARYQFDSYEFDDIPNPWHNINTLSLASILQWHFDDRWTPYAGGFIKMSAESSEGLDHGVSGGGLLGVNYKFSDTLTFGGGLAIFSQIKDDTKALPLITGKWQFAPQWRLDVGLTDVANLGYGADVKWMFNNAFDFSFGGQFHRSRFRIDGAGASSNGVGQETAMTLYADATWHATPRCDVGGFFGLAFGGKLRLEDSGGHELAETDYDTAPIIGIKASLRF